MRIEIRSRLEILNFVLLWIYDMISERTIADRLVRGDAQPRPSVEISVLLLASSSSSTGEDCEKREMYRAVKHRALNENTYCSEITWFNSRFTLVRWIVINWKPPCFFATEYA